jgi:hypothetical protein
MPKILFGTCALIFAATTGLALGQDIPQQAGGYETSLGSTKFRAPNGEVRQDLVAAISTWLSAQFSLPAIEQQPIIKLVPPEEITALRYHLSTGGSAEDNNNTVAIYQDRTQTIYLADDWNGSTPAEQSILVHEMVHHFQNILGLKYECRQAREEFAYRAQDRWLIQLGHDLATDFELDAFSLLVKTKCFY